MNFAFKVNNYKTYPHSSSLSKAVVFAVEHVYVLLQLFSTHSRKSSSLSNPGILSCADLCWVQCLIAVWLELLIHPSAGSGHSHHMQISPNASQWELMATGKSMVHRLLFTSVGKLHDHTPAQSKHTLSQTASYLIQTWQSERMWMPTELPMTWETRQHVKYQQLRDYVNPVLVKNHYR